MLFFISIWLTGSNVDSKSGYITTEHKERWIKRPSRGALNNGILLTGKCFEKMLFIPKCELIVGDDGFYRMKSDGREIRKWEDYYILEEVYARANVPRKYGGLGIPCWLYHPAALNWTFLIGALPVLGLGAIIKRQIK
jgi:hypothetical protein